MIQSTLIAAGAGLVLSVGAYFYGRHDGAAIEGAKHLEAQQLVNDARAAMIEVAAESIAKIEVKHVTIRERLDTEIREGPVYRDCRHTPDGLRLLNEALSNGAQPAGQGILSAPVNPTG